MYTKHNLLPTKITSKLNLKPELASVAFYGNRTIATDSFRLLEVSAFGDAHEPVIIHKEQLKSFKPDKKQLQFSESDINATPITDRMYPDVDKIMKEDADEDYTTVTVNGALFGELLMQMAKMNRSGVVTIKVPNKKTYSPMHIYANSHKP